MEFKIDSIEDLPKAAKSIIDFAGDQKVWLFDGEMGVGKTTLIKTICECLSVVDHVSSPTFSLVNEYKTRNDNTIYHFDLYRIEDEEEALQIGLEDYLYAGHVCLIEWPSKIPSLIPDNYLKISIILEDENQRKFNLDKK